MTQAFFTTRQTAKLMDDFVRELSAGAGLFLLYGDPGVGKTRTLKELARTRLGERKVRWIDLKAGGGSDGALVDSSVMIENVFGEAEAGDIIIADHFQMALKKTRHQLFLSWSTDGMDRHLNLIIAGNTDYFNELRQLTQQYQVSVRSFQHGSLKPDEAEAFLGAYLFPERSVGKLSVPPLLRNQLATAQGNISDIIDVAERAGDQITAAPMDNTLPLRQGSRVIIGLLGTVAIIAGAGWYYLSSESLPNQAITTVEAYAAAPATVAQVAEETIELASSAEISNRSSLQDPVKADLEMVDSELVATQIVTTTVAEAVALESQPDAPAAAEPLPQPEALAQLSLEPEPEIQASGAAAVEVQPSQGPLQRDLAASLAWIDRAERKVGTLQIMLLNEERFDEQAYYEYVGRLEASAIDTSTLRILPTLIGDQEVYSVVYGEYESWTAAGNAKLDLPEILRKTSPIPRSVGGLLDEIRRLEGQN